MKTQTELGLSLKVINEYVTDFDNLEAFQAYARKQTTHELPDNIRIDNVIYTMDNYDLEGKEINAVCVN